MNVTMDYETARNLVDELGWTGFINAMNVGNENQYYKCSTAWLDDKSYMCKLKGARGDLIIQWT